MRLSAPIVSSTNAATAPPWARMGGPANAGARVTTADRRIAVAVEPDAHRARVERAPDEGERIELDRLAVGYVERGVLAGVEAIELRPGAHVGLFVAPGS